MAHDKNHPPRQYIGEPDHEFKERYFKWRDKYGTPASEKRTSINDEVRQQAEAKKKAQEEEERLARMRDRRRLPGESIDNWIRRVDKTITREERPAWEQLVADERAAEHAEKAKLGLSAEVVSLAGANVRLRFDTRFVGTKPNGEGECFLPVIRCYRSFPLLTERELKEYEERGEELPRPQPLPVAEIAAGLKGKLLFVGGGAPFASDMNNYCFVVDEG